MTPRFAFRLDAITELALDEICARRRCDRTAAIRWALRSGAQSLEEPKVAPVVQTPSYEGVPCTASSLHQWLGLEPPSDEQSELYSNFPSVRGVLGGSDDQLLAVWVTALSHMLESTILVPDVVGLRTLEASVPVEKWKHPELQRRLNHLLAFSDVPDVLAPRAWVTARMSEDGNYPDWFINGLGG